MELKTVAYPKVNIGLYIGEKREDGYHSLISIFHIVKDKKYFDDIDIKIDDSEDLKIEVCGLENTADSKENTVFKVSRLFFEKAGVKADVHIDIKKRIPSLAGLGGGSSDAGAVLLCLNSFYKIFNEEELKDIALKVGSDVPFFAKGCVCALVEGRGEIVSPIKAREDLQFTLLPNDMKKISTANAYAQLDNRGYIPSLPTAEELKDMYYKPVSEWNFFNDFDVLYLKDESSFLTGSGTCRFVVKDLT